MYPSGYKCAAISDGVISSDPHLINKLLVCRPRLRTLTTGYLIGFLVTLFLSTVLRALRRLMSGVENLSVPGLRATSQNILWSTTKVNEAFACPPHVT
jgi:hypothetical protein